MAVAHICSAGLGTVGHMCPRASALGRAVDAQQGLRWLATTAQGTAYRGTVLPIVAGCVASAALAYHSLVTHPWQSSTALSLARADSRLRGALASVLPHDVFVWLYSTSRPAFIAALSRVCSDNDGDVAATAAASRDGNNAGSLVMGLRFRNDLGNSAGLDKVRLSARSPNQPGVRISTHAFRLQNEMDSTAGTCLVSGWFAAGFQLPNRRGLRGGGHRAERAAHWQPFQHAGPPLTEITVLQLNNAAVGGFHAVVGKWWMVREKWHQCLRLVPPRPSLLPAQTARAVQ
eukprot:SAG11_NODE_7395_length_1150_cov_1.207422_1_plen_289_part_00